MKTKEIKNSPNVQKFVLFDSLAYIQFTEIGVILLVEKDGKDYAFEFKKPL